VRWLLNNLLNFKGVKDGLNLQINNKASFEDIKNAIKVKAENGSGLIKNSDLIGIIGKKLSYKEKAILEELLSKLLKINVLSLEIFSYNDNKNNIENEIEKTIEKSSKDNCKPNGIKFIETTLRSGNEIISDGHIVVLGDVNPGAILKAKGNILVMGKLRGIAHAGIDGNDEAFIAANSLMPNQIRISDIISRAPDNADTVDRITPEKALISDGRIIIERL
jgi:septum site-determining protein MinC